MFAVITATAEGNLNRSLDLSQSSDSFTSISGLTFRQPIKSVANRTIFPSKCPVLSLHSLQLHNPNPSTPSLGPSALPTVEKDSPGKHSPCSSLAPRRLIMTVPKVYGHGSWILEFEAALAPCFLPLCWDSAPLQGVCSHAVLTGSWPHSPLSITPVQTQTGLGFQHQTNLL